MTELVPVSLPHPPQRSTVKQTSDALATGGEDIGLALEHFDVLAGAVGGVEAFRALVLHFAIQGRVLGAQAPQDGGETPTSDGLTPPFGLPAEWAWRRVDEAGDIKLGRQRSPKNHSGPNMRPYLRVANVFEARIDTSDVLEMNFEPAEVERFLLEPNDILLNEGQSYELIGRPAIYRGEVPGACFQNTLIRFRARPEVLPEFALIVFRAYMRTGRFRQEAQQTTNIAHLSAGRLAAIEFPIPPLAEQKRIVAKVDELMALCDELEARQVRKREVGAKLTTSALEALTTAEGPEEFEAAWKRVAENFETVIDRAEKVGELRRGVLELAVRGRLTPAAEGDASTLLRLIAEDIRQNGKAQAFEPVEAAPYALPMHWRWIRWGQLTLSTSSGWSPQCESRPATEREWGVLKVSAVSWGAFQPSENKALPPGVAPRPEFAARKGDFLMSRANTADLVGRSVVVEREPGRVILSDKIVRCVFSRHVVPEYIDFFNRTAVARNHYVANASGTSDSMKNISREVILNMPVALPPHAEQLLIVQTVKRLLSACDALEAQLCLAEDRASSLAEAVVRELTA